MNMESAKFYIVCRVEDVLTVAGARRSLDGEVLARVNWVQSFILRRLGRCKCMVD